MADRLACRARVAIRWAPLLAVVLTAACLAPATASARLRAVSIDNVARSLAPLPLPAARPVVVGAVDPAHMKTLGQTLAALGATARRLPWNAYVVTPPASQDATAFARTVLAYEGVRYARPDGVVRATTTGPNDPDFGAQWGLSRIGAPAAWTAGTGTGIGIAIIDTGMDTSNPDLASRVDTGTSFVGRTFADDNGHGTHVAGIAAAIANNAYGIAGTAPDARLLIAKALDYRGLGTESDVASAIYWAVANGAKIISMSLATTDARGVGVDPLGDAVAFAEKQGCLIVAAAGNTGAGDRVWPAAYEGVVAVAATDQLDRRASFSSTGTRTDGSSTAVLSAPGVGILSYYLPPGTLAYASGTSMATPFVAGSAAGVWAANPGWTAAQVTDRLTSTALDLPPAGRDTGTGYGRVRFDVAMGQPMSADAFEPDDATATALAAGRVLPATAAVASEWHDFAPAGEVDAVCVDLVAGRDYQMWTSDLSGGADTALTLYAPDGTTVLGYNDDASAGSAASYIRVRTPLTGRHVLVVRDPRSHGGGYVLNTLALQTPTSLSIRANTTRPRYRRYFTLSGALWPSMPGTQIVLQVLRPGTRRWIGAAVISTYGAAPGNGTFWSRRYRPTRRGTYRFRVRYGGDATYIGSSSATLSRRVR